MKIKSIYTSINGEINDWGQGRISTFVQLAEEDDPPSSYTEMTNMGIVDVVIDRCLANITIIGGEPLKYLEELTDLIEILVMSYGMDIVIETDGRYKIPHFRFPISWVINYKLPSSGVTSPIDFNNYNFVTNMDVFKFVVKDAEDYLAAVKVIEKLRNELILPCKYTISPVFEENGKSLFGNLSMDVLVKWMIIDGLADYVLININLHNFIKI